MPLRFADLRARAPDISRRIAPLLGYRGLDALKSDQVGKCWRRAGTRAVFMLVVCGLLGYFAERSAYNHTEETLRETTRDTVTDLRVAIERALTNYIERLRGVVAYVRGNPELDQGEFVQAAAYLTAGAQATKNVALARDLVVSHVYPIAGNEQALGLDYREHATQWPMVARTIRADAVVLVGPLDLVQGGRGVIARAPVRFPDGHPRADALWGVASVVIDLEGFLEQTGLRRDRDDFAITISAPAPTGAGRQIFVGDPEEIAEPAVVSRIKIRNAVWTIRAAPRAGWPSFSDYVTAIALATGILVLAGFALIAVTVRFELELIRLARQSDTARQVAEDANQAKSVFLANMSHEVRTPLNAVLGYTELIQRRVFGPIGDARYERYLDDIHRSGRYLLDLLTDVLDLARVEAGGHRLELECVPVSDVIEDALTVFRHGQTPVQFEGPGDLQVVADVRALKQVFINIIGNAIKHGKGTQVRIVTASDGAGYAVIRFEDKGPGIPPDALPRVTEPFFTGAERKWTAKHTQHGTGIGLALVRRLVEAMNGRLTVASEIGHGTTVTVALPECGCQRADQGTDADSRSQSGVMAV